MLHVPAIVWESQRYRVDYRLFGELWTRTWRTGRLKTALRAEAFYELEGFYGIKPEAAIKD